MQKRNGHQLSNAPVVQKKNTRAHTSTASIAASKAEAPHQSAPPAPLTQKNVASVSAQLNSKQAVQQPAVHPVSGKLADSIANNAKCVATRTNTVGWCYRGVKEALRKVGVMLSGTAAWMAKGQLLKDPRFAVVPLSKLKKGDILVHDRSDSHPYGHIAVYLGGNAEASDHVQHLVKAAPCYGGLCVFRPLGTTEASQQLASTMLASTQTPLDFAGIALAANAHFNSLPTVNPPQPKPLVVAAVPVVASKPQSASATHLVAMHPQTHSHSRSQIAVQSHHRNQGNTVLAYIDHRYARGTRHGAGLQRRHTATRGTRTAKRHHRGHR